MKVKNVLISQNAPADYEKSPYSELTKKFSINIDFCKFFQLEGISGIDFRKNKINLAEHTAVVFSSKNTIDYFFQLTKELRVEMPESTKYICPTDQVAHYLQKYVQYRKRKILFGKNNNPNGIFDLFLKNKTQKFLIPCGEDSINSQYVEYFEKHNISYSPAVVFHTVITDLKKEIDLTKYDMIVFFSPHGIASLKENYPDFEQKEVVFAALGLNTAAAIQAEGWNLQIMAPTKLTPSITTAISLFLKDHATRKR